MSARRSRTLSELSEDMLSYGHRDIVLQASLSQSITVKRGGWLGFLLALFIGLMTLEGLIRKWVTTVYMVNYRTLLNSLLVFACTLVFFALVTYNNYKDGHCFRLPQRKTVFMYFLMSIGDMLAFTMIILSVAFVKASTAACFNKL